MLSKYSLKNFPFFSNFPEMPKTNINIIYIYYIHIYMYYTEYLYRLLNLEILKLVFFLKFPVKQIEET